MWKKSCKISIKLLVAVLLFLGLEKGCNKLTKSFRYNELLSDIPNDPRWEVVLKNEETVHAILKQPFYFMGKGGQSVAFVSSDGKYVLKFFRHSHLHPVDKLLKLSIPNPIKDALRNLFRHKLRHPHGLFNSFKLSYEECADETGFLFLHLNKTKGVFKKATLVDKCGIKYPIDLDATEFALQKKAEPLFATFQEKIAKEGKEGAKEALYQFLLCYKNLCQKGIKDKDGALGRNIGFIDGKVVIFDTGSFMKEEELKSPIACKQELEKKGFRIHRWLEKYHPEILSIYQEQLEKVLE